ncbi:MAG: DNA-protecting protein DprA [Candidimonas sp.]|nr:MAG: DNA-protecting protein DprA [Candidimonas sp.]
MPANLPDQERDAWIRLSLEPGLGAATARRLLAAVGLPHDIFALPARVLTQWLPPDLAARLSLPASGCTRTRIAQAQAWLEGAGHHLLTLADMDYPAALLHTHDPPLVLYVNGDPAIPGRPAIAIVGARHATPAGMDNAWAFARHLAAHGWCIVSGLARGIDAAAHRGALSAGPDAGGTIAVMATGIDTVYPAEHDSLARQIREHGALISEFPLGTEALPHRFPKRNRVVAGLTRGVLVVEAARRSGSLITARLASEAGREVFAIPGSIHSPLSRGCHALIRQGAKLVESGRDITDELAPGQPPGLALHFGDGAAESSDANDESRHAVAPPAPTRDAPAPAATGDRNAKIPPMRPTGEQLSLLDALGYDPVSIDVLYNRSRLSIARISQRLLELELSGHVARLDDGRFQRRPS